MYPAFYTRSGRHPHHRDASSHPPPPFLPPLTTRLTAQAGAVSQMLNPSHVCPPAPRFRTHICTSRQYRPCPAPIPSRSYSTRRPRHQRHPSYHGRSSEHWPRRSPTKHYARQPMAHSAYALGHQRIQAALTQPPLTRAYAISPLRP